MDSGAAGVEHRDDGNAQLEGLVHKGGDLVALDFAERAALDREVLSVDGDRLPCNRADSRHDSRAGEPFGHVPAAEAPDLGETPLVEEFGYAFAGRLLADGVLARLCLFLGQIDETLLVGREVFAMDLVRSEVHRLGCVRKRPEFRQRHHFSSVVSSSLRTTRTRG